MRRPLSRLRCLALACALGATLGLVAACQAPPVRPTPTALPVARPTALAQTAEAPATGAVSELTQPLPRNETLSTNPTAEPSPTPRPTLALTGEQEHLAIQQAVADGDPAQAILLWEDGKAQPGADGELRLAVARAYADEERRAEAAQMLMDLADDAVQTAVRAPVLGLLATLYERWGEWQAAIDAYRRYLELNAAARPYVEWRIAQAQQTLQDDEGALVTLFSIEIEDLPASFRAEILEKRAQVQRRLQQHTEAVITYDRILSFAQQPAYRALVAQMKAAAQQEGGQLDEAITGYTQVLEQAPDAYAAYLSLATLRELGQEPLDGLTRARALLAGRQYTSAEAELQNYIKSNAQGNLAEAHYQLGLTYEKLGRFGEASKAYDVVMQRHLQSARGADAWFAKARVEQTAGNDATSLYREFWRLNKDHPQAPEALWMGAQALERRREWSRAQEFYGLLRTHYGTHTRASEAFFREGLMAWAGDDVPGAQRVWEELSQAALRPEAQARVLTWLGLAARRAGEAQAGEAHWNEAVALAPTLYYGLRAADLRDNVLPVLPPESPALPAPDPLEEQDWRSITLWINGWYTATSQSEIDLDQAPLAQRGLALLELGWHTQGVAAIRQILDGGRQRPHDLLALSRWCEAHGIYTVSIAAAEQLRWLGQQAQAPNPPDAWWRLAYPLHYGHLVDQEAHRQAVDPLLFLALLRQESRFDAQAVSYAGATGLAQVMPETGKWIAERIGPADFRVEWLTRPALSVRYGVWYLKGLLDARERDWIAALVGYNAGPGNLQRWTDGQPIADYDLFYETMPVQQTQDYIRTIYTQYRAYQRVYGGQ